MIEGLTKSEALDIELRAVDFGFKYSKAMILNTAMGGGMPPGTKGTKLSAAQKKRLSELRTGTRLSDETKAKMSATHKLISFSEEHARKLAEARRHAHPNAISAMTAARSIPVIGVSDDGEVLEFPSAAAASRWIGSNGSPAVSSAIYRAGKAGGYRWYYRK
jgi:hypothetical protein